MTEVSYDALSELCLEQNRLIYEGVYDDVSPFCDTDYELAASVVFDPGEYVYVIAVEYAGVQYNLKNNSGMIYFARYQDGGLLNTIRVLIDNMYTRIVRIDNALTQDDGLFDLWFSLFNERMAYIGTGIDLINKNLEDFTITGGNVSFDTKPITDKLTDLQSAVNNKGTSIVDAINNIDVGTSKVTASIVTNCATIVNAVEDISLKTIESTLSTISTRLHTQNGYVDGVEGLLSNVVTAVNGINLDTTPVVNAINTKGNSIVTAVDGVAAQTDRISQKLYEFHNSVADASASELLKLDELKTGIVNTVQNVSADRDALLGTIISKMDGMSFELDVDSLNFDSVAFDTRPIVDSIDALHADFTGYFAQFGENIDYGEKSVSLSGSQEFYWDSDSQSYLSGSLTGGSNVTIYRMPDVTDGRGGVDSSYPRVLDDGGLPVVRPSVGDRFPGTILFKYEDTVNSVSFSAKDGFTGSVSGKNVTIDDGVFNQPFNISFYGKTVQSGTPSSSSPVMLQNVGIDERGALTLIKARVTDGGTKVHQVIAVPPEDGLRGIPVSSGGNHRDENGQRWYSDTLEAGEFYYKYIGSMTLNGSENWQYSQSGTNKLYFFLDFGSYGSVVAGECMSTHFKKTSIDASNTAVGVHVYNTGSGNAARLCIRPGISSVTNVTQWKSWLAKNPVTVYYVLTEPEYLPVEYHEDMGVDPLAFTGTTYEPVTHIESDVYFDVVYQALDPISSLYADNSDNWYFGYKSGDSARITNSSTLAVLRDAFNVRTYTDADSIIFNDGKNHVSISDGGQLNMSLLQGNKIIMWYVNWAHGSRAWLGERLDAMQLTPVLQRLDQILDLYAGSVGSGSCEHVYVSEINQEASCALPGLQTFTCRDCGSCYSEIIPSSGHDWLKAGYVENEFDPVTGEPVTSAYQIYTCSICQETYNDYDGSGAPNTQSDTVAGIISRVFEKIGTIAGELIAMVIRMLDKLLTGFDDLVTDFNTKTEQIAGFGGDYPMWLAGVWEIVPPDLMLALGFCVVVGILAIIGKKLVFS